MSSLRPPRPFARPLARRSAAVLVAGVLPLALSACGAERDAQTYQERSQADASNTAVGVLALRGVAILPPEDDRTYAAGEDAEVVFTVTNNDDQDDRLLEVTAEGVESVEVLVDGEPGELVVPPLGSTEQRGEPAARRPRGGAQRGRVRHHDVPLRGERDRRDPRPRRGLGPHRPAGLHRWRGRGGGARPAGPRGRRGGRGVRRRRGRRRSRGRGGHRRRGRGRPGRGRGRDGGAERSRRSRASPRRPPSPRRPRPRPAEPAGGPPGRGPVGPVRRAPGACQRRPRGGSVPPRLRRPAQSRPPDRRPCHPSARGGRAGKDRPAHRCSECGTTVAKWVGQCPQCSAWGTLVEVAPVRALPGLRTAVSGSTPEHPARPLAEVVADRTPRELTGLGEFDRVLGGGLVAGQVVLLAGEPGVGKSTLVAAVAHRMALRNETANVLYVSGEESVEQISVRARRTGATAPGILLADEHRPRRAARPRRGPRPGPAHRRQRPDHRLGVASTAGPAAWRRCRRSRGARPGGQVPADCRCCSSGSRPGRTPSRAPRPRAHGRHRAHLRGRQAHRLRLLRAIKNRYGPADEVVCFEQADDGLREVRRPVRRCSAATATCRCPAPPSPSRSTGGAPCRPRCRRWSRPPRPQPAPGRHRARQLADGDAARGHRARRPASRLDRDVFVATVGGARLAEPALRPRRLPGGRLGGARHPDARRRRGHRRGGAVRRHPPGRPARPSGSPRRPGSATGAILVPPGALGAAGRPCRPGVAVVEVGHVEPGAREPVGARSPRRRSG